MGWKRRELSGIYHLLILFPSGYATKCGNSRPNLTFVASAARVEEDKPDEVHPQEDAQQQQEQEQEQEADESDQWAPSAAATDEDYQQMQMSNRELPPPPSVYTAMNT